VYLSYENNNNDDKASERRFENVRVECVADDRNLSLSLSKRKEGSGPTERLRDVQTITQDTNKNKRRVRGVCLIDSMILPQVHLRKPCYDFSFL